jgi:F-type H+/Na+-transporting ATPase subunit alpha
MSDSGNGPRSVSTLLEALQQEVRQFQFDLRPVVMGTVTEVGDGIVRISGLRDVVVGEMLEFEAETQGMAMNLEAESVGAVVLGPYEGIREGDSVRSLGRVLSVPTGDALLGRVVDALGRPIDDRGPILTNLSRPIERVAPGIIERTTINVSLHTGIKAVDALVPIGRGQRELIIGDRQTGKTTVALDAILSQSRDDVLCVYVAIGQKLSTVAQLTSTLERHGAMDHTIVVSAEAGAPTALQYVAPYAGCAMAEEFMERGRDVLIVYDDLTKHAWAYRQISLLLRRPPGREAYPGDIFYLHARLLERAGRLSVARGGGSMTALPVIETQMGDLAAYIPTNVISITDGQIFLEAELFHSGVRPAINAGLSVSRIAGAAQSPAMKAVAGELRLRMAQFRELEAFAQFGTDVDKATQESLDRGMRIREVLKQDQHHMLALEDEVAILYAVTRGHLDDIPLERIGAFEEEFIRFLRDQHQGLRNTLAIQRDLTPEVESHLIDALQSFRRSAWTSAQG